MKRTLIEIIIAAILIAVIVLLCRMCSGYKDEAEQAQRNTETLMTECEQYRIADSLNVARRTAMELTLSEYRKHRSEDYALIQELKAKKRELERIATVQTQTIQTLKAAARDTIVIRDSVEVPAKVVDYSGEWCDLHGEIVGGEFTGSVTHRDSLIVVESVKMTHCIVKKWRKIKEMSIEVVSKNPNTIISSVEYVIIEK